MSTDTTTTTDGWAQDDGAVISHLPDGWDRIVWPDGYGYEFRPSGSSYPETRGLTEETPP
jgi:hypothetical protein